jgi:CTP-dependent riboflavin kinase
MFCLRHETFVASVLSGLNEGETFVAVVSYITKGNENLRY